MASHSRRRTRIETDLPLDLRQEVNRLLIEGETYEAVTAWLADRGHEISRSAVGRYGKAFFEAYQKVLRFEDQSRAIQGVVEDGLLMEEATTKLLLQQVMEAAIDGTVDVLEVPRLLSDVAKLQSSAVQREKWKDTIAARCKDAAEAVARTASKGGLSDATVGEIRRRILGIAK